LNVRLINCIESPERKNKAKERFDAEKERKRMLLEEEKQGDKNMKLLRARKTICDVMYRYSIDKRLD